MGFTHIKFYSVGFFSPKEGGRMIHFRGSELLYFLSFLKKNSSSNFYMLFQNIISKQFANISQGFPNSGILAADYLSYLRRHGNYCCPAVQSVPSQG